MSRISQRIGRCLFTALIVTLFAGCTSVGYKAVSFDVLRPASYTLPTWADSIIIVDGVTAPVVIDSTISVETSAKINQGRGKIVGHEVCKAMAAAFNNSGYMKAIVAIPNAEETGLSDANIDTLLRGRRHTIILSLKDLRSESKLKVTTEYEIGATLLCGIITSATETGFELIASPASRFPLTHRNDTIIFKSCELTPDAVAGNIPTIEERYTEQAKYVGQKNADAFIPAWQKVYRSVYISTDPDMLAAQTWIEQDNWDEAVNLWGRVSTESRKAGDRVRAMMNISLAYERADDPIMAGVWCSRAIDTIEKLPAKEAEKLSSEKERAEIIFAYLIERQKQKETLDTQMQ
ncbi:MAG: DUF6340 family protein [Bacteroidales bacterium]|nr:DUF6340 family protein [Bacteroidales bacterium]MDY4175849.1 DUF6340 family protein [Bacteroidales bacterium]